MAAHTTFLTMVLAAVLAAATGQAARAGNDLPLEKGDHISIIGNTLADRMQHDGYLETFIQLRFPELELTFRNLGFAGDEVAFRQRSDGFGSPDEWLARTKTDVVFAMFGYNESFKGEAGLEAFREDLGEFVDHTLTQQYNGESAPRVVLFSPIAHENLNDPHLPDGRANNERLKMYAEVIRDVAQAKGVHFVDLFRISAELYEATLEPMTINGIHLNELGNKLIAESIDASLFASQAHPNCTPAALARVRPAVQDKNHIWYNRYRTIDGYSMYGGRSHLRFVNGQTNRDVMMRELEVLDVMTANRDKRVRALANGKDMRVDDSNTPPFLEVITNKPGEGPNGEHIYLGGEEAISKMTIADGLKVELFASEEMFPELVNPVQMAFDTKGRLWVAAWRTYPHWKPKDPMDDKLLILEDTDGDGRADVCKTFVGDINSPTGFEFYGEGVIVGLGPDLVYFEDTDGDDKADVRQRLIHGLGTADTHHTANSFVLDPGGGLYMQEGTFHRTQVESPWGPPVRVANGGVYRYEPRTQKFLAHVSYPFANPHGHVFDRWGQDILHDGTGAVPYDATMFSGRIEFPRKHTGMPRVYNQRTRPCAATEYLSSSHFPESMRDDLLVLNVIGFQGILRYDIEPDGGSFKGTEQEPLLYSSDPSFRPVDLETAPDGSLYFLDWQNPVIGHMQHNLRDPSRDQKHGRVYRITAKGRPLVEPPAVHGQPIEKLVKLLEQTDNRLRYRAKIELAARDSVQVIAAVNRWVDGLDKSAAEYEHHLMEALWVHQYHDVVNEALLRRMLRSPDHRARAAATKIIRYWRDRLSSPLELLRMQVNDPHPRVRLEAVVAASDFHGTEPALIALDSLKHEDDRFVNYVLRQTMSTLEPYWKPALASGELEIPPTAIAMLLDSIPTEALTDLPRIEIVNQALLHRPNVDDAIRREALTALAHERGRSRAEELVATIREIDGGRGGDRTGEVLADLGRLLTTQSRGELASARQSIEKLAREGRGATARQIATAALITADGSLTPKWTAAGESLTARMQLLASIQYVSDDNIRSGMYPLVRPLLKVSQTGGGAATAPAALGRYVRVELPGDNRILSLAEVQVFSAGRNIATRGRASQDSIGWNGEAKRAIDGNTNGNFDGNSVTHSAADVTNPWWEVDLRNAFPIEAVKVWNRTDTPQWDNRLSGFTLTILDSDREPVFTRTGVPTPAPSVTIDVEPNAEERLRQAAVNAITHIPGHDEETFAALAGIIDHTPSRITQAGAITAMGQLSLDHAPADQAGAVIAALVEYVEAVPPLDRGAPAVIEALDLGQSLATRLPTQRAAKASAQLRGLGMNIIEIRPIPHEMLYDLKRITVEAGKPVRLIFENIDIMPHNLVVGAPGSLSAIGQTAESMALTPEGLSRGYVPDMKQVLWATKLLFPGEGEVLTFIAPDKPGKYPYLCTFPGHYLVMNGVMEVVEKFDPSATQLVERTVVPSGGSGHDHSAHGDHAAHGAPDAPPARKFVKMWELGDLLPAVQARRGQRSAMRGRAMLDAAGCMKCHKYGDEGKEVGPDLTKISEKYNAEEILAQIVNPSEVIAEGYESHIIETWEGQLLSGIIVEQNDKLVRIAANTNDPEAYEEVLKEDIAEMRPSPLSMMPTGMLVTLERAEILDLVAFLAGESNSQ